ncbi:MAG: pseudouridine synthase [Candidatus Angelobacter sp.]|jgi:tRNA pseudouridine32 synthase/23S rRNA pseudouridine746 synthase|nr:pseudouridine synthase [Candidatus Angelobacter sp.]
MAHNRKVSIAPQPARIQLPSLATPPATVLEFLCERFSRVPREIWAARIDSGKVCDSMNAPITPTTRYQPGMTVFYFREVEMEAEIPFQEIIVFENEHLLVADKPHFLPTTPAGDAVNECLLYRLQRRTGNAELAPLHRLDRETAGLVMFGKLTAERAVYTGLFAAGEIERTYRAVARVPVELKTNRGEWLVENRLEAGSPWFRMKIVAGEVNARTKIVLENMQEGLGLFELQPQTGKKHQLRIHMMSLGFPILNDEFYPELNLRAREEYLNPLQLLASEIRFRDPLSGEELEFLSERELTCR